MSPDTNAHPPSTTEEQRRLGRSGALLPLDAHSGELEKRRSTGHPGRAEGGAGAGVANRGVPGSPRRTFQATSLLGRSSERGAKSSLETSGQEKTK